MTLTAALPSLRNSRTAGSLKLPFPRNPTPRRRCGQYLWKASLGGQGDRLSGGDLGAQAAIGPQRDHRLNAQPRRCRRRHDNLSVLDGISGARRRCDALFHPGADVEQRLLQHAGESHQLGAALTSMFGMLGEPDPEGVVGFLAEVLAYLGTIPVRTPRPCRSVREIFDENDLRPDPAGGHGACRSDGELGTEQLGPLGSQRFAIRAAILVPGVEVRGRDLMPVIGLRGQPVRVVDLHFVPGGKLGENGRIVALQDYDLPVDALQPQQGSRRCAAVDLQVGRAAEVTLRNGVEFDGDRQFAASRTKERLPRKLRRAPGLTHLRFERDP
ncbi:hypothetical protein ACFSLT_17360 [Novosphingobium resinovorum]